MITDSKLNLGEIVIPNAGNIDTDVLDFQLAKVAFGGGNLFFNAVVSVVGAGGTSAQIKLIDSPDNSTWTDVVLSAVVLLADLVVGKLLLSVALPSNIKRYVKGNVIGTGAFTGGKVKIFFTLEPYQSA
jgi:hypothetical protein